MLQHRSRNTLVRRACELVATLALISPLVGAQIVQPGDVIAVSESVTADTLRVYDGCTGALKTTFNDSRWISSGNGRYVDVAPDGTIWVGDRAGNRLYQYDRNLQALSAVSVPCGNGKDFSFDNSGRVVITTSLPNGIVTLDPLGSGTPICQSVPWETWGLDVMPSGNVCVSLHTLPGLQLVAPQTGTQLGPIDCGGSLGMSWSVDALQGGLIVVAEWSAQQIRAVDPTQASANQCVWSIPLNTSGYPYVGGMSVNEPLGLIFVAVFRNGEYWLERYRLSDQTMFGPPTRMQPLGSAFPPPHTIVVVPGGTCSAIAPFCFGDGTATLCPCGNSGDPGHGCAAANLLGGGVLGGAGSATVTLDTVQLTASFVQLGATGLFFQGDAKVNGGSGRLFGDGLRCVTTNVIRLGVRTAGQGNSMSLGYGIPGDPAISVVGVISPTGGTRYYQVWYRNTASFCMPEGFNLTSALSIVWSP